MENFKSHYKEKLTLVPFILLPLQTFREICQEIHEGKYVTYTTKFKYHFDNINHKNSIISGNENLA